MDDTALRGWYDALDDTASYSRRCRMFVPAGLRGLRVLDVNCRNGKGACKLVEAVGPEGFVLGTCLREEQLAKARAHASVPNLAFEQAFPEDLRAVAADGTFDVAYINSSLNVAYDPPAVLAEIFRVLAPGGRLVLDTVLADGPRDAAVLAAARRLGNVVQAAPFADDLLARLRASGFSDVRIVAREPIAPAAGAEMDTVAPTVPSDETVAFFETVILATR